MIGLVAVSLMLLVGVQANLGAPHLLTQRTPVHIDPCLPSPCGPNAECHNHGERPVCTCLIGYEGNPLVTCIRGECIEANDCPSHLACQKLRCIDPCGIPGICGSQAECRTNNHQPICSCGRSMVGNPYVSCRQFRPEADPDLCSAFDAATVCKNPVIAENCKNLCTTTSDFDIQHSSSNSTPVAPASSTMDDFDIQHSSSSSTPVAPASSTMDDFDIQHSSSNSTPVAPASSTMDDTFVGPYDNVWSDEQCPVTREMLSISLAQCKIGCENLKSCTAINFAASDGKCVLRNCITPVPDPTWHNPPYKGYRKSDITGSSTSVEFMIKNSIYYLCPNDGRYFSYSVDYDDNCHMAFDIKDQQWGHIRHVRSGQHFYVKNSQNWKYIVLHDVLSPPRSYFSIDQVNHRLYNIDWDNIYKYGSGEYPNPALAELTNIPSSALNEWHDEIRLYTNGTYPNPALAELTNIPSSGFNEINMMLKFVNITNPEEEVLPYGKVLVFGQWKLLFSESNPRIDVTHQYNKTTGNSKSQSQSSKHKYAWEIGLNAEKWFLKMGISKSLSEEIQASGSETWSTASTVTDTYHVKAGVPVAVWQKHFVGQEENPVGLSHKAVFQSTIFAHTDSPLKEPPQFGYNSI